MNCFVWKHSMGAGLSSKHLAWVFILLLVWMCGCKGCTEDEKMGLLELKAFVKSSGENADALLPSWIDNSTISECCSWERVVCHPTTHRVEKLLLNDIRETQHLGEESADIIWYENDKFWLLNVSMFLPFQELHHLNLSVNSFDGFIGNEGFEVLSSLKKLEVLDICGNEFDQSVLRSLGMITSLKILGLCKMRLHGSFPIQEFASLRNLKVLDLRWNGLKSFQLEQDSNTSFIFANLETLNLDGNIFKNTSIGQLNIFTSLRRLSLSYNSLEGFFPIQELAGLENLKVLDLSGNRLESFQLEQGFKNFSKLQKLEILNLGYNRFNKTIIEQLSVLVSLKTLDLRGNSIEGPFPSQAFTRLTNLEILDLSQNLLSGTIPPSIQLMSSLKSLSLAYNSLNGSIFNQGLCNLKRLQELDLSYNFFEGILPPCLNNLTSLRLLDLSYNSFSGNLTCSLLANLTILEYIDLSNNLFEGPFSFNCFANHSNLQAVLLGSENKKFSIEAEDSINWVPIFQIKFLVLSNCKITGRLPNFLQSQSKLISIDISHNNLTGRFPNWLLENNIQLEYLNLRNNSLTGQLLLEGSKYYLHSLDISNNQLDGKLQENLANMIPNVKSLNLSKNGFEGILPSSIADFKYLWLLDLSSNNFSGEVLKKLFETNNLEILKLSNNKFEGDLSLTDFSYPQLSSLYLNNNQFYGTLSNTIVKAFRLWALDLSNNNLSGEIPSGICNMTSLQILVMGYNGFKGKLPYEISQLQNLVFLDVSHNALSGHLPLFNTMQNLKHLHLQGNMFEGSIPNNLLNSSSLLTLDIRDNRLFGRIPNSIYALSELRILLLSGNFLSGFIPNQLCHLTNISLMDLSNNNFYGSIPSCFGHIHFGDMRIGNDVFKSDFQDTAELTYLVKFNFRMKAVINGHLYDEVDGVEFVTKYNSYSYRGETLNSMSGLDLSRNNLTGEIPHELGMLSSIHALNLSHNQLMGSIPKSFFNLSQIESLDLSYNQLSGEIPFELVGLNSLSVFNLAHNNISGSVPDKAQFLTFGESSYEGNPFLCGQLLKRKCKPGITLPPYSKPRSSRGSEEKWYDNDDRIAFFASFGTSYFTILLAFLLVLYINPYWRRRWFNFIEECLYSCYYFVCDTHSKLLSCVYN